MDPITIASLNRPIVFFLTRSDVFTPVTKPILWAFQMIPIYRSRDKVNTQEKNEAVFRKCAKILSFGRNLLIFGEGVTHDVFTRRLKPIKKGAVRNWIHSVGIRELGEKDLYRSSWNKLFRPK
jgi:1-acyl-sn-glycerol-3-phosphate acyltransferase